MEIASLLKELRKKNNMSTNRAVAIYVGSLKTIGGIKMCNKVSSQDFYQIYRTVAVEVAKINPNVWWLV